MLTRIPGFRVGHATDVKGCTGCTVILCPEGTVGGVDVRGSAAGTRNFDALSPLHLVPHVHAVLLAAENTTLAVVATNARLSKVQATKMAQMGQHGLIRTIAPVHTTLDGDLVIGLATGPAEGGMEAELNAVGLAAADAVAEAIIRAVRNAASLGGLPAWADLQP